MDAFEEEQLEALFELDMEQEEPDNVPEEVYQEALYVDEARREAQHYEEDEGDGIEEEEPKLSYEITITLDPDDSLERKCIESVSGISEVILNGNYFVTDAFTGELYVFIDQGKHGGTYIEATQTLEWAIRSIAKKHNREEIWTKTARRKEVYNWINNGLKVLENPDCRHLNVANGLVYIAPNGEFIHYSDLWSPDCLTTVKLPIYYDKDATCPAWEKFISEIFPPDSHHIAWQLAALLMIPLKNKAASAIVLKGEKNTGKTTFQNGIIAFLGQENVSNLSIDRFGERFQDTQLKGKLANVVGEMPNTKLTNRAVNIIKKLIGNDWLSGEIKNGANFKFLSYARCLFSCNEMPSVDSDEAFFDRFIIIPFVKQFDKNPVNEKNLNELLSSPEELSGLFNKALGALPSVIANGIKPTDSMLKAHEQVVEDNDPIVSWFKNYIELGGRAFCSEVHEHYKKLEPTDFKRKSNIAFGRALKKLLPNEVKKTQIVMDDGSRPYIYSGIKLVEQAEELDQTGFIDFDLENLNDGNQ